MTGLLDVILGGMSSGIPSGINPLGLPEAPAPAARPAPAPMPSTLLDAIIPDRSARGRFTAALAGGMANIKGDSGAANFARGFGGSLKGADDFEREQTLMDLKRTLLGDEAESRRVDRSYKQAQLDKLIGDQRRADTAQRSFSDGLREIIGDGTAPTSALPPSLPQAPSPQAPAASPEAGRMPVYANAISKVESGGRYNAQGPVTRTGDRAYGKYQVMGENIGPWTQEVLGRAMTPQEFLADPKAQDAVFEAKFGQLAQKHGPEGAARAWFAGEGGMNDPNRKDQLGTSVASYGERFTRNVSQQDDATLPANARPTQGSTADERPNWRAVSPTARKLITMGSIPGLPSEQREMVKTLLSNELDSSKLTNDQKEFLMARGEGYQGSFVEYKKEMKRAGANSVNVNMGGDTYHKKLNELTAGEVMKQHQEAKDAADLIKIIHDGRSLVDQGMITGAAASYKVQAIKLAKALGIDISQKDADNSEVFRARMGEAVGKIIKQFGAGTGLSDADRDYAERIAGGKIELNEDAIRKVFDIAEKAARGRVTNWQKRLPDIIKGDINTSLAVEEPPAYQAPARPKAGNPPQPQPLSRPPVTVQTPEEARRLPPGTRFIGPDGQVRTRP